VLNENLFNFRRSGFSIVNSLPCKNKLMAVHIRFIGNFGLGNCEKLSPLRDYRWFSVPTEYFLICAMYYCVPVVRLNNYPNLTSFSVIDLKWIDFQVWVCYFLCSWLCRHCNALQKTIPKSQCNLTIGEKQCGSDKYVLVFGCYSVALRFYILFSLCFEVG